MFRYLLLVLAVWCHSRGYVLAQLDTVIPQLPDPMNTTARNCNETADLPLDKINASVVIKGSSNQYVAQQIISIYGLQQFKRFGYNFLGKAAGEDYLISPGIGAHKLHRRRLTWNKARQICVQEGGQLAIINSIAEEKILLHILQDANITVAWLGIHDLYEEGDWVTVTGEPLESTGYTGWTLKFKNSQPDNAGGNENCATLIVEGGMNDVNCNSWNFTFFCEIPI